MSIALPVGLSRNGGHGSIEESEIFHFSPNFLCSALVSGGVILAAGRGAAGTPDHRPRGMLASFVGSLVPAGLLRHGGRGSIEESELFRFLSNQNRSALVGRSGI